MLRLFSLAHTHTCTLISSYTALVHPACAQFRKVDKPKLHVKICFMQDYGASAADSSAGVMHCRELFSSVFLCNFSNSNNVIEESDRVWRGGSENKAFTIKHNKQLPAQMPPPSSWGF